MNDYLPIIGFDSLDSVVSALILKHSNTRPIHGYVTSDDTAICVTLISKCFLSFEDLQLLSSLPSCCNPVVLFRYEDFYNSECLVIEFIVKRSDIPGHVYKS